MIHVSVVHRLRLAHLGQIYRDLDLDFTGLFKDQRDVNGFILNKWRMKPYEHDVIAATFQKQLAACGNFETLGNLDHTGHAAFVDDMGVQLDHVGNVRTAAISRSAVSP